MSSAEKSQGQREHEIFFQALDKHTPEERAAFLDGACADEPGLRRKVDALLVHHFDQANFMQALACGIGRAATVENNATTQLAAPTDETIGATIGRYKLRERLGEGGCGIVYVAEQSEPVRRRVALKLIKPGMDTREVIARFQAERQALAMMDHSNIAKVFDAGTTDAGRPYFVMELVRGIRITDYCDQANLTTAERLELFIKVCQTIHHAHEKGIIHRDIKPSNILVTLHDGVPVPKVIDFGIAKATQGRLADATVYTQLHQFLGTPAYMSPEQAEMSGLDVDTRSDIYSLGVLLYQLLTGKTPFDSKELLALGLDEMRRTIREKEPPRPSTRVARLTGEELTTTARRRSVQVPKLIHLLKKDLDWIVMKALEKDRARRYESANGFAQDVRRYLSDQPVTARVPSVIYRVTKFVRRRKSALAGVTTIALLAAAGITSTILLYKERQAARFGGITVNSNPEGAEVWRNGKRIGLTPLMLPDVEPGNFTYSLLLTQYESVTNTTPLAAKQHMNDFTFLRRTELSATTDNSNTVASLTRTNHNEFAAATMRGMMLISMEGAVEVSRKGPEEWVPAFTNLVLLPGDRLRTGSRSRAVVRGTDLSITRLNANTVMQLSPPSTNKAGNAKIKLDKGSLQFFERNPTNMPRVLTPAAEAAIKG